MLAELNREIQNLPFYLRQKEKWTSLLINKYPPTIWRLSYQISETRILMLQKIFDDANSRPYIHSHSWDLAVKIYSGGYEMGLGYSNNRFIIPEMTEIVMIKPGDSYEILDENIFHYTKILDNQPSFSVMLIGPRKRERLAQNQQLLQEWQKEEMFEFFTLK